MSTVSRPRSRDADPRPVIAVELGQLIMVDDLSFRVRRIFATGALAVSLVGSRKRRPTHYVYPLDRTVMWDDRSGVWRCEPGSRLEHIG